jgi:hypothetical protein
MNFMEVFVAIRKIPRYKNSIIVYCPEMFPAGAAQSYVFFLEQCRYTNPDLNLHLVYPALEARQDGAAIGCRVNRDIIYSGMQRLAFAMTTGNIAFADDLIALTNIRHAQLPHKTPEESARIFVKAMMRGELANILDDPNEIAKKNSDSGQNDTAMALMMQLYWPDVIAMDRNRYPFIRPQEHMAADGVVIHRSTNKAPEPLVKRLRVV